MLHIHHFFAMWMWFSGIIFSVMAAIIHIHLNNNEMRAYGLEMKITAADYLLVFAVAFCSLVCFCFSPLIGALILIAQVAWGYTRKHDLEPEC